MADVIKFRLTGRCVLCRNNEICIISVLNELYYLIGLLLRGGRERGEVKGRGRKGKRRIGEGKRREGWPLNWGSTSDSAWPSFCE